MRAFFSGNRGMNAASVFSKQTVVAGLKSGTKDGAIEELIEVLVAAGRIADRAAAVKAVLDREKKMSTGLQSGIAIPHAKTETVANIVAAIGIRKEGIPFESLDGLPAQIIVLTLSPPNKPGPHIQFLAEISKSLSVPAIRERILAATDAETVLAALIAE